MVRYFSEYIFVMYAGEIVEMAEMEKLLGNPQHPYTVALMEASADPDAKNALVMRDVPPVNRRAWLIPLKDAVLTRAANR